VSALSDADRGTEHLSGFKCQATRQLGMRGLDYELIAAFAV
jgi:hypothetical protein